MKDYCMNCDQEFEKEKLTSINGELICKHCVKKDYYICEVCKKIVHQRYKYDKGCVNCN